MTNILKIITLISIILLFFNINAQEATAFKLNIDTRKYPVLKDWSNIIFSVADNYDVELAKKKLKTIANNKWQSVYISRLLKQVDEIKLKHFSVFNTIDKNKIIINSDNTLYVYNKERQIVLKKEFSKDDEITSIYKNNNILICAVSKFDKFCENSSWQLYKYNLSTNQESVILSSNNANLLNTLQQITGKCPLLKNTAISPNNKALLINAINIEYKDYCYNLVFKNSKNEFKLIKKSCNSILKDVNFLNDDNIFFVEQEHTGNHFKVKKYNTKLNKYTKTGCFISSGIVGEYIKHEIIRKGRLIKLYHKQDSFLYISDYDFNGKLLNQERIKYHYKQNVKKNMHLFAFNNRVFKLNKKDEKVFWEKPAIFHEYDILDFYFDNKKEQLSTIDETGILKHYNYSISNNYLLIVENSKNTVAIPVNLSINDKRISEITKKTKIAKENFVKERIEIENKRAAIENAYTQIFDLNDIKKEDFIHNIEGNISENVIFELNTNRTFHKAKVFHIIEYNNEKRYVTYFTGSLNNFIYNKNVKNQLLSILPDESIGYIDNKMFKKLFKENKNKKIITLRLKYYNSKETEKILNSLLHLKKKKK